MKRKAIVIAVMLVAASRLAYAQASATPVARSQSTGAEQAVAPTQGMWRVVVSGDEIDFYLRPSDLGVDHVVWKVGERSESWQLIRWTKEGDHIVLWSVSGRDQEMLPRWTDAATAVARLPAVAMTDGTYRIRVTQLFHAGFPKGWGTDGESAAPDKLGFQSPKSFPRNVVVQTEAPSSSNEKQEMMRWNFVRLPERRMATRSLYGRNAFMHPGFLQAKPFTDIPDGQPELVLRWRLEGAGAGGRPAEPLSPIIVYLDPNTPEQWKSWVKLGIESWQKPFEAIGYRAAIQAVDSAKVQGWDHDDVRYSALCWRSKDRCRWKIFDPRTGEILQAQIHATDSGLESLLARYVVTMAASDARVLKTSLTDTFLGDFFRMVAAHEVGHLLGLKDGTYGTFAYTPDQVRDREWVKANGFTPSIMNYARFNYLAQPADYLSPESLKAMVGPADRFWIRWGYSERDSEEDLNKLWISSDLHRYRRTNSRLSTPYDGIETPGVSDPVEGAILGMTNLERSMALLSEHRFATSDPAVLEMVDAESLHKAALVQWFFINKQVVALISGKLLDPSLNMTGEPTDIDSPGVGLVDRSLQAKAVRFLCASFFGQTPSYLVEGPLFVRSGANRSEVERDIQKRREEIFALLTEQVRFDRLREIDNKKARFANDFGAGDLLRELRGCVLD